MPKQFPSPKPTTVEEQRTEARSPDSCGPITTDRKTALHPEAEKARENEYAKTIQALRGNDPKIANVAKCLRELDEARPYEAAEFFVLQVDLYKRAYSVVQQTANAAGQRSKLTRVLEMCKGKAAPSDADLNSLTDQMDSLQQSATTAAKKASLHDFWRNFVEACRSSQPRLYADWTPDANAVTVPDTPAELNELQESMRRDWEQQANFLRSRNIQTEHRDGWLFTAYRRPSEQSKRRIKIVNSNPPKQQ